ncbi:Uncharacterized protein BM_BM6890 [Brugia malayi]|uniref:BMA-RSR-2; Cwf21 domain-containing protein n=1 Tax=Brugia malayi TaxID=6279 RepID=A0A4E9FB11_BRUMA|nr:Uncharacterized protein BM_BM6890 [Brugia malayi]VIO94055.1 Uncharacterized protein BM_BM6890 [Brugia malayi]
MYNGIGLQTARGSGTNGYVQANLANLLLSKKRVVYNSEADIKRAEAEINKQPNKELLEHNRKRHIELKCADFEMLMENKGFDEAEIQKKVNEYRKLLQSQVASGELDIDAEMDSRDTHVRAKAAMENRDRMRSALGIKDDFIDGTSFEKLNKSVDLKVDEIEQDGSKEKKKKDDEVKKSEKKRKTAESSSSSSSSLSEESSDNSSEYSSDSDDSSTNSVHESSGSNSSEVSEAKVQMRLKDISHKERNLTEKIKESREVEPSSDRRDVYNASGFVDREKRRRRDSPDHYDRSYRHQRHSDDHFDYRRGYRSSRSYGYDDGGRRDRHPRRNDHRSDWHRRNDSGSDRRRKHDRDEKRNHREKERCSRRTYQYSPDSDTDRKQKHHILAHSDGEGPEQFKKHSSSVEEDKGRRSKLREVIPDTKDIKAEPALSPDSMSSKKNPSLIAPPFCEESNGNARNKTPVLDSSTTEIALPEKQFTDVVKMEIDVQESKMKILGSNEGKEKVEQSSGHKRLHRHSSEINDSSQKRYRHDTPESEDKSRSSSSSNDEFLHHSGSTHSSTTSSNGDATENILNGNSDEIHSPSHSPEPVPDTRDQNKKLESREKKIHLLRDGNERSDSDKHRLRRNSVDDNHRQHWSRSSHFSRLESDHGKHRHRYSGDFHRHRRHHVESSGSKLRRSESHESRHRSHHRSTSRPHRLSRRKSHSNDSLYKRHHEERSRTHHSKRQVSRSRSRPRRYRKHSTESRRSASCRVRKSASSSQKRPYSPRTNNIKSRSTESSSEDEVRIRRRRHDTSSSKDERDKDSLDEKQSYHSSESCSSSSSSRQSPVERSGKHSNNSGKKQRYQCALREPIDESD